LQTKQVIMTTMRARPTPEEAHGPVLAAYDPACNRAIKAMGLPLLLQYFRVAASVEGGRKPWVSIGSGRGSIEALVARECGLTFICVDPNPTSFQTEIEGVPTVAPLSRLWRH